MTVYIVLCKEDKTFIDSVWESEENAIIRAYLLGEEDFTVEDHEINK